MKRIVAGLLASAVSLSFLAADISLANAAPIYVAPSQTMTNDIQQIDHRPGHPPRANPRYKRPDRRPGPRPDGRHEYRRPHNNDVYWRGHRGYREPRPGYKRHGDYWFPLAAFATGMIISGAIANSAPPPPAPAYRVSGNAHVNWCYNQYRSYRASDNTFQPYNGPRKQCVSPYY